MSHEELVGAHEEKFKGIERRIEDLEESSANVIALAKDIVSMKGEISHAVKSTSSHIEAGAKWRLAIVIACIGLIGGAVSVVVKFSVMDYKVSIHDSDIKEMRNQIYDLNYLKGRAEGIAEKEINK